MHRKSKRSYQLDIFSNVASMYSGKAHKEFVKSNAWHNVFREQVTMQIDESIFSSLYSQGQGRPNASIRVMITMMILKEADGISDQKIFEACRYNMLYRSAIGLLNINESLPTESTYYLFRSKVAAYEKETGINLISEVFNQVTQGQIEEFEVSGQRIRMDSKLLGSNITWLSRYELIHETLSLHYKKMTSLKGLDRKASKQLKEMLEIEANKVTYTQSSKEIRQRMFNMGKLIFKVLKLKQYEQLNSYQILKRVFEEQYRILENQYIEPKDKEEIGADSVQSPHDPDCTYRHKGGTIDQKVKGYSVNITETCDDEGKLNLIVCNNVQTSNTSDVNFLQPDIKASQQILNEKIKHVHTDGAYHNVENQRFCKEQNIDLHITGMQGTKGIYEFEIKEDGSLTIIDSRTQQEEKSVEIKSPDGTKKWRIKTKEKGYRYFYEKNIENYFTREKLLNESTEILQKRNNVEATIFQLAYHCRNGKTRYRGLTRHRIWSNMRCLWVNFVRITKYILANLPNQLKKQLELAIWILQIVNMNIFLGQLHRNRENFMKTEYSKS